MNAWRFNEVFLLETETDLPWTQENLNAEILQTGTITIVQLTSFFCKRDSQMSKFRPGNNLYLTFSSGASANGQNAVKVELGRSLFIYAQWTLNPNEYLSQF